MDALRFRRRFLGMPEDEPTHETMVDDLIESGALQTPECMEAFKKIDRQQFWVDGHRDFVYADTPLRYQKLHQSAPHMYANALEALMPMHPGTSFLNIGSGTGYFSCLVSELIGEMAVNEGVDVWPENVEHARERCRRIGKTSVEFTCGNVYNLDVNQCMRYDRIYIGACANSRSKYLYGLLEIGGVLVGPFQAGQSQQLRRVVRRSAAHFDVEVLTSVQFSSLVEPSPSPKESRVVVTDGGGVSAASGVGLTACGLPNVPFTFVLRERCWTVERNDVFPARFRDVVAAVLSDSSRDQTAVCLPPEVWRNHLLPMCPRFWFEQQLVMPAKHSSATPAHTAMSFASEAAKRALRLRKWSAGSVDSESTRASVSGRSSRSTSEDSFEDSQSPLLGASSFHSCEVPAFFLEAFSNGQEHVIGSPADPDNVGVAVGESRGPFAWLPQVPEPRRMREGDGDEQGQPVGILYHVTFPLRFLWRCVGNCAGIVHRVRARRENADVHGFDSEAQERRREGMLPHAPSRWQMWSVGFGIVSGMLTFGRWTTSSE